MDKNNVSVIHSQHETSQVQISDQEQQEVYSKDPANWVVNDALRDYIALHGFCQNENVNFSGSKRQYNDCLRFFLPAFFERKLLNGKKTPRQWLIYSESRGSAFCDPCLLYGGESAFSTVGVNDWKNANQRLIEHERSDSQMHYSDERQRKSWRSNR